MPQNWFYRARLATLLAILFCVLIYAARDVTRRNARRSWEQPLRVGVVLLKMPDSAVPSEVLGALDARLTALGEKLDAELQRYRAGAPSMFQFTAYGPVETAEPPPQPIDDDWFTLTKHAYHLWRYSSRVNALAHVPARGLDSVIYVVAEPVVDAERKQVEGYSEQGGRVGVARIQLDETTVDLCLFVVAHELFHTLGASDKYDARGRSIIPQGLGDPEQRPLYPQLHAEVMARNRVLSARKETIPVTLEELRVGRWTAQEIGWER
jgi:hypothetical protein